MTCAKDFRQSCLLDDYPPLGTTNTGSASLADIEQRLFVSHPWMADSFLRALAVLPPELFTLFNAVSGIVIADDIRPSFYSVNTATIYIDPRYLWRDEAEWRTIADKDDYRDEYQSKVNFIATRQYVDDNGTPTPWVSGIYFENNTTRTTEQLLPALFRLLSHELAHANDIFPPLSLATLDPALTLYQNSREVVPLSELLYHYASLNSALLNEVAGVLYHGDVPSDRVSQLTAQQAGEVFEFDGANDMYSYSSPREDVAMLFQSYMLYQHYGWQDRYMFLSQNGAISSGCERYTIEWGQTGRLFEPSVRHRMHFVVEAILQQDLDDVFTAEYIPQYITPGTSWCDVMLPQ